MQVWSLGLEGPEEEEMATHASIRAWKIPSIHAWKIPWREEPGVAELDRTEATERGMTCNKLPLNLAAYKDKYILSDSTFGWEI